MVNIIGSSVTDQHQRGRLRWLGLRQVLAKLVLTKEEPIGHDLGCPVNLDLGERRDHLLISHRGATSHTRCFAEGIRVHLIANTNKQHAAKAASSGHGCRLTPLSGEVKAIEIGIQPVPELFGNLLGTGAPRPVLVDRQHE